MIPREACIADPTLLWVLIVSNLAIALAYGAIPWELWRIHRSVPGMPFPKLGYLFMAFISCCGGTHLLAAAVIFWPAYLTEALICVATATVSLVTAMLLRRLRMPIVIALRDYLALVRDVHAAAAAQRQAG